MPNQYTVRSGATLSANDTVEKKVDLQVATQKGVDLSFSSAELTMDIDDFSSRIIEPAMAVLAATMESDALGMYKDVYNLVDNAGSAITFKKFATGRKVLTDNLAPTSNRCVQLCTQDNLDFVDTVKGLYQDSASIAKQYKEGLVGSTVGFGKIFENTLLARHTLGGEDGNYITNGAAQDGTSLIIDTGTGTIKEGDVFTIAGVNRVHPETKVDTGVLQQFVCSADSAGGGVTITMTPELIASGGYQNVSAKAADGVAVTFAGTASGTDDLSLGYHRDAFVFATADLEMPKGVDFSAREVYDGISIRLVRDYDIANDLFPCRLDVYYGYKAVRPELAVRYANN